MMRIGLLILSCLMVNSALAYSNDEELSTEKGKKDGSYITFTTRKIDVGTIYSPWKTTVVYEFRNTGDEPLVVQNITTDCGCTVAEYTRKPIKPGKKGIVTVTYDGQYTEAGYFHKTITVVTNSWRKAVERLYLEGTRGE
ncbi:MAG: DUF1573 domain-containing protein [Prevotella sp.]|nr:DUF1573 domain-containing protein [Prevotella sp.]MBP5356347.1 DUF1573 domain-containing protein [Prevotella sp.]